MEIRVPQLPSCARFSPHVKSAIHCAFVQVCPMQSRCCCRPPQRRRNHPSAACRSKSTLSQHFKVLREAGLIRSERLGVEMQNTSRCKEIDHRFPGLIAAIVNAHKRQQKTQRGAGRAAVVAKKVARKGAAAA